MKDKGSVLQGSEFEKFTSSSSLSGDEFILLKNSSVVLQSQSNFIEYNVLEFFKDTNVTPCFGDDVVHSLSVVGRDAFVVRAGKIWNFSLGDGNVVLSSLMLDKCFASIAFFRQDVAFNRFDCIKAIAIEYENNEAYYLDYGDSTMKRIRVTFFIMFETYYDEKIRIQMTAK